MSVRSSGETPAFVAGPRHSAMSIRYLDSSDESQAGPSLRPGTSADDNIPG